jgi:hypothetical protein
MNQLQNSKTPLEATLYGAAQGQLLQAVILRLANADFHH